MKFENTDVNQYERRIIGYLLRDKSYVKRSLNCGMNTKWFDSEELRYLFTKIKRTYENYGVDLSKRLYMDGVHSNEQIEVSEYSDYGKFYDWAYHQYDGEDNFEFYLSKFKEIGINNEIALTIKEYSDNFSKAGGKESLNVLKRKINYLTYDGDDRELKVIDYVKDVEEQLEDIKNRKEHPDIYSGIKTGYSLFDEEFRGFHKGTVSLIVGLTGTGKTTFTSNIAANQCFRMNKNILIFTLEDSSLVWSHKLTSSELGINFSRLLDGRLTEEEYEKIKNFKKNRKHNSRYVLFEMAAREYTVGDIEEEIERRVVDAGDWFPDIIYVDQLSLVRPSIGRGTRFDIEFGDVTKGFSNLAKKYNIPVVITGQVSNAAIRRTGDNHRTHDIQLENIAQSSQPSQDARCVIAIQQTNLGDEDLDVKDYKIKILKQSYGRAGVEVDMVFHKSTLTFMETDLTSEEVVNDGIIKPEPDVFIDEKQREIINNIIDRDFGNIEDMPQSQSNPNSIEFLVKSIGEFTDDEDDIEISALFDSDVSKF